ncbi:unnamed protein product, partial [Rotaria magnacalcarata]
NWKVNTKKWAINDPSIFLTLYAISGCDTTSFTRNITKANYFLTYLSNPNKFQDLHTFGDNIPITIEPLEAAENLLVLCYKNTRGFKSFTSQMTLSSSSTSATVDIPVCSLNDLRTSMASNILKIQRQIYAQNYHLRRIHFSNIAIEHGNNYGYRRTDEGELVIRWMTIPVVPNGISLTKCMKCTNGCHRCKCSTNNLSCTPFCGCSIEKFTNRANKITINKNSKKRQASSSIRKFSFDDDFDSDIEYDNPMENTRNLNCEDDNEDNDEEVSLEFIYDNNDDASFISSTKNDCLNDNESQSNRMNVLNDLESSYCYQSAYQSTSCLSNNCRDTMKNLTSSPLHSTFESN